MIKVIKIQI